MLHSLVNQQLAMKGLHVHLRYARISTQASLTSAFFLLHLRSDVLEAVLEARRSPSILGSIQLAEVLHPSKRSLLIAVECHVPARAAYQEALQ